MVGNNSTSKCLLAEQESLYAIATMVSTRDYVVGANVLLYSLRKHLDPKFLPLVTFVALFIEGKSNDDILMNLDSGWQPCFVPLISPARPEDVKFERFKEQFTKLALWRMVGFTRVLYLASDTLAVGDFAPLLTNATKPFAAVRDWERGKVRDHFNMGVASLAPNLSEFKRLDHLRLTKRDYRLEMAEQGLLNSVYGNELEEFPF